MARILILEDKIDIVNTLKSIFEDEGYTVDYLLNPQNVLEKIASFKPDLITLDVSFSDEKDVVGIDALEKIRSVYPDTKKLPVIVISGTVSGPKMQRLGKLGINDYFRKPIDDVKLLEKIKNCLQLNVLQEAEKKTFPEGDEIWMIGESPKIVEIMMDISNAAHLKSNLLILGETGTGKEVAAKIYHQLSPRNDKPFVLIDCPCIQPNLFESEVFGIESKTATEVKFKKGKIEEAESGIIFFDEIGDLAEEHQKKLLRLLQDKTFCRVGSNEALTLDAIILAATNRPLYKRVQEGEFREDLFYRLKINKIEMPPLRERIEDIPELVEHFIKKYNQLYTKDITRAENDVIETLKTFKWRGNVRELEKCIESAVVNCKGTVIKWEDVDKFFRDEMHKKEDLSVFQYDRNMKYDDFKAFLKRVTDSLECEYYTHNLKLNKNNKTRTAKSLGMSRQFLNQILERLHFKET